MPLNGSTGTSNDDDDEEDDEEDKEAFACDDGRRSEGGGGSRAEALAEATLRRARFLRSSQPMAPAPTTNHLRGRW